MNLGNIGYTDAANTRIFTGNFQQPAGALTFPIFTHTFGVDNRCPFFRIFAGACGDGGNTPANAFSTSFDFTNGGSPVSKQTVIWGVDAVYNVATSGAISGLSITPFMGGDTIIVHSQLANLCVNIGQQTPIEDVTGFLCRWTALADKVVLTTSVIPPYTSFGDAAEYFHGIIQQPWGN